MIAAIAAAVRGHAVMTGADASVARLHSLAELKFGPTSVTLRIKWPN